MRNDMLTPEVLQRSAPGDSNHDARLYIEYSNEELRTSQKASEVRTVKLEHSSQQSPPPDHRSSTVEDGHTGSLFPQQFSLNDHANYTSYPKQVPQAHFRDLNTVWKPRVYESTAKPELDVKPHPAVYMADSAAPANRSTQ